MLKFSACAAAVLLGASTWATLKSWTKFRPKVFDASVSS
eukprot:CAMPEP_0194720506 /NCGR_PEP_ID=MMETSP0296-20130528/11846_1 /TAXON_ID=39354 /ORGANISM="Heterosigma akashiwo, Strain CCMP2393" /LENGTH=38 /DNA_ID= /DNA_START= /DNA_END= /DNA_ORIENTATION=